MRDAPVSEHEMSSFSYRRFVAMAPTMAMMTTMTNMDLGALVMGTLVMMWSWNDVVGRKPTFLLLTDLHSVVESGRNLA